MKSKRPREYKLAFVCPECGGTLLTVRDIRRYHLVGVSHNPYDDAFRLNETNSQKSIDIYGCAYCDFDVAETMSLTIDWLQEHGMIVECTGEEEDEE